MEGEGGGGGEGGDAAGSAACAAGLASGGAGASVPLAAGGEAAGAGGFSGDREMRLRLTSWSCARGASERRRFGLGGGAGGFGAGVPDGACSIHFTGPSTLNSHFAASSLTPGSRGISGSSAAGAGSGSATARATEREREGATVTSTRGRASLVASSITAGRACRAVTARASWSPPARAGGSRRASSLRPSGATTRRRLIGSLSASPAHPPPG